MLIPLILRNFRELQLSIQRIQVLIQPAEEVEISQSPPSVMEPPLPTSAINPVVDVDSLKILMDENVKNAMQILQSKFEEQLSSFQSSMELTISQISRIAFQKNASGIEALEEDLEKEREQSDQIQEQMAQERKHLEQEKEKLEKERRVTQKSQQHIGPSMELQMELQKLQQQVQSVETEYSNKFRDFFSWINIEESKSKRFESEIRTLKSKLQLLEDSIVFYRQKLKTNAELLEANLVDIKLLINKDGRGKIDNLNFEQKHKLKELVLAIEQSMQSMEEELQNLQKISKDSSIHEKDVAELKMRLQKMQRDVKDIYNQVAKPIENKRMSITDKRSFWEDFVK